MNTDDWQGNVSTILKFAYMLLAPYIAEILTEDQFAVIGVAVVGLIIAIWDAYNPNTFKIFKNNKNQVESETEEDLYQEYSVDPTESDNDGC